MRDLTRSVRWVKGMTLTIPMAAHPPKADESNLPDIRRRRPAQAERKA